MKISIITTTYNSAVTVKDTLQSVNAQTYHNIEHIIVDGASKDNTLDIVREYGKRVAKVISEPDKGIYDAMNKGIREATGDIIGILNSDDVYASESVLANVMRLFDDENCDGVYGNLNFVRATNLNEVVRLWKSSPYKPTGFSKGWHPPHPTFFVRKEIYNNYGLFDISLDVSADFELMLRFIEKHKIDVCFLDEVLVKMRYGGESTGSIKKIIAGNKNIMKAFKKNDLDVSYLYPFYRLLPKLKQFIPK